MAKTDVHRDLLLYLIDALRRHFQGDPTFYVSGNLFVYYEEGNPSAQVAPDVFVVRGVPGGERRTYKVWKEGRAPELVIELTSRSTHLEDLASKRTIYEGLGVREYLIFDPEGDRFDPPFRAFRLEEGALRPARPHVVGEGATAWAVFRSEVVGLELHARGTELRWVEPGTGRRLLTTLELARLAKDEACRAEEERRRAEEGACEPKGSGAGRTLRSAGRRRSGPAPRLPRPRSSASARRWGASGEVRR